MSASVVPYSQCHMANYIGGPSDPRPAGLCAAAENRGRDQRADLKASPEVLGVLAHRSHDGFHLFDHQHVSVFLSLDLLLPYDLAPPALLGVWRWPVDDCFDRLTSYAPPQRIAMAMIAPIWKPVQKSWAFSLSGATTVSISSIMSMCVSPFFEFGCRNPELHNNQGRQLCWGCDHWPVDDCRHFTDHRPSPASASRGPPERPRAGVA